MTIKYEIVRMPSDSKKMSELLEEFTPFLDAMYSDNDKEIFGDVNFLLDYWLFLWDTSTGFFLTKRNSSGDLLMVAVLTKYRDIWHGRERLEVHRTALARVPDLNEDKEIEDMIEYLISVATIMGFEFLYYNTRDAKGNEHKELMWIS